MRLNDSALVHTSQLECGRVWMAQNFEFSNYTCLKHALANNAAWCYSRSSPAGHTLSPPPSRRPPAQTGTFWQTTHIRRQDLLLLGRVHKVKVLFRAGPVFDKRHESLIAPPRRRGDLINRVLVPHRCINGSDRRGSNFAGGILSGGDLVHPAQIPRTVICHSIGRIQVNCLKWTHEIPTCGEAVSYHSVLQRGHRRLFSGGVASIAGSVPHLRGSIRHLLPN